VWWPFSSRRLIIVRIPDLAGGDPQEIKIKEYSFKKLLLIVLETKSLRHLFEVFGGGEKKNEKSFGDPLDFILY
jgi:hypothetical protein